MKMKWMTGFALTAGALGCANGVIDGAGEKGSLDIAPIAADGKGDIGRKAKVLDELAPDSQVRGTFDTRVRVYGTGRCKRSGPSTTRSVSRR